MIAPTISPHDPRIVFEHCDMTGAYVTLDGGLSWRMFNLYGVVNAFAYDPSDPKVVYAGNWALWRSEDTGKTWRMIFPDPQSTTIRTRGDHAETYADTRDPAFPKNAQVGAIVVDGDSLFVAFGGYNLPSTLFVSNDRGAHWERPRGLGEGNVLQLYRDAPNLYVVGEHGIDVQTTLGWQRFPAPGKRITSASIGAAGIIYAVADGLFVSSNGGQTWTAVKQAPGKPVSVACSAKNPRTAYAGFSGLKAGPGPENLFNGIAKTTDGGATWTVVHKESNRPSENLKGSWIEARAVDGYPNIWFDSPYTLGIAPTDPNICYATDLFRTYNTNDGGKTWTEVNSIQVGPDNTRPRRHDELRGSVRSVRLEAHLYRLYGYWTVPKRRRRSIMDRFDRRPAQRLAQHDILGRVRSQGTRPHVGRICRYARPAAAQNVARHRSGKLHRGSRHIH
jgi:photosystem II stability/assembly factor-like uncharacterized protein